MTGSETVEYAVDRVAFTGVVFGGLLIAAIIIHYIWKEF